MATTKTLVFAIQTPNCPTIHRSTRLCWSESLMIMALSSADGLVNGTMPSEKPLCAPAQDAGAIPCSGAARTAPDPDSVTARLIQQRRGSVIPIADANGFFSIVHEYVQTLADTHRPNPDSIELLVTTTKQYLSKPDQQIRSGRTTELRGSIPSGQSPRR